MRMTKIHATIGPASWDEPTLEAMMLNGLDGCRINFSHTSGEKAEAIVKSVRSVAHKLGKAFTVRQDLQGPKLRIGQMAGDVILRQGEKYVLQLGLGVGGQDRAFFDSIELYQSLSPGDPVVLADGRIRLQVLEKADQRLVCEVRVSAGPLSSKKGINAPGVRLDLPAVTDKDRNDLKVGLQCGVDVVSLSFVKNPQDVILLKSCMADLGRTIPVISKIELRQAMEELDEIIEVSDGISIARGDLQVEFSLAEVPSIQRQIIRRCNEKGKFVMVGSGVLSSMKNNPLPSLGDVSDIFLAVESGPDVISLSDETAIGQYPVQCIQTMNKLITEMEGLSRVKTPGSHALMCTYNPEDVAGFAKSFRMPVVTVQKDNNLGNWLSMHRGVFVTFVDEPEKTKDSRIAMDFARKLGLIHHDNEFIELQRPCQQQTTVTD